MIDYTRAFIVTCPKCGTKTIAYWRDTIYVGGVDSADCPKCEYIIRQNRNRFIESEGNPVEVKEAQ